jgi:peptidoglycan hydrolase-like protein with peptidoglycan-binding domain
MRIAIAITAAALVAAAPAGAQPSTETPLRAAPEAHTAAKGRTMSLGTRGKDVRRLRRDLVDLGYLPPRAFGPNYDERVMHAVTALQKWENLPRDGAVGKRTRRAIRRLRTPRPELQLNRRVRAEVLLDRQLLLIIHGDHVIRTLPISSGAGGGTPPGTYTVYSKAPMSWSKQFEVWLPWASYFNRGIAFHGYPDVPVVAASHGCVRVPMKFAREVYNQLPPGARVDVITTSF